MSFLSGGSRHTLQERGGERRGERGGGSIDQCEAILKGERGEGREKGRRETEV